MFLAYVNFGSAFFDISAHGLEAKKSLAANVGSDKLLKLYRLFRVNNQGPLLHSSARSNYNREENLFLLVRKNCEMHGFAPMILGVNLAMNARCPFLAHEIYQCQLRLNRHVLCYDLRFDTRHKEETQDCQLQIMRLLLTKRVLRATA